MGRAVTLEPKTYPISDVTKEFVGIFGGTFSKIKIFMFTNQCFITVFWWMHGPLNHRILSYDVSHFS
jgi:hypothetical protein